MHIFFSVISRIASTAIGCVQVLTLRSLVEPNPTKAVCFLSEPLLTGVQAHFQLRNLGVWFFCLLVIVSLNNRMSDWPFIRLNGGIFSVVSR